MSLFHLSEYVAETLDVGPGTSVFEVACASGDFLVPLHDNGFIVGGMEVDPLLIAKARHVMPRGQFVLGSPAELDPGQPWQVVVCRTFGDFPNVDYARGVLARMAATATHAVALLNVPEESYDRRWLLHAFAEVGVSAVQMEEPKIAGVANANHRLNVFARL